MPAIVALRDKAEAIRKEELENTLRKLGNLGEKDVKAIEALTNSIVNKLIHFPTAALKSASEDTEVIVDIVSRIFDLNTGTKNKSEDPGDRGNDEKQ